MKSYYDAHESAYKEIKEKGYVGWGNKKTFADLGDPKTFEYLKSSILKWSIARDLGGKALDLGCGTGTTAFTMAQLGYDVTGIDISETAIEMARELATSQNFKIQFTVGDILKLKELNQKFDLIYDSHCLHCIVLDEDRKKVYSGVKSSLSSDGIFILDTSIVNGSWNPASGNDSLRFDEDYILWHKTKPSQIRGVVELNGQHWCAQRRFYPATKIMHEVTQSGFKVISQYVDVQESEESDMLRLVLSV